VSAEGGGESASDWTPPTARERLRIIQSTRTVALLGASANIARPSYFVATYMVSSSTDFEVYFVNPTADEILGHKVYPSLDALPVTVDLVDVFRKPDDLPAVADEVIAHGAKTLWIQLGLWSDEAARRGHEAGLNVVMNRCLKIEHARFHGGLHLAGFDTGVISSRRRPAEARA
jgi:predicted CoA-binding protein